MAAVGVRIRHIIVKKDLFGKSNGLLLTRKQCKASTTSIAAYSSLRKQHTKRSPHCLFRNNIDKELSTTKRLIVSSFRLSSSFSTSSNNKNIIPIKSNININAKSNDDEQSQTNSTTTKITSTTTSTSSKSKNDDDDDDENANKHSSYNTKELIRHWLHELQSIPNIITTTRIASSPLLSYLIISEQYELALYGCMVAGFSDWLDGYLAKNYNMKTVLGTYLDPLADKVLINTISISLWYTNILPTPIVLLFVSRDVILTVAAYNFVKLNTKKGYAVIDPVTTTLKVEPTFISKVNTAMQFLTLTLGLLQPLCAVPGSIVAISPNALEAVCWITGGTTLASGLSYVGHTAFSSSGNAIQLQKPSIPSIASKKEDRT